MKDTPGVQSLAMLFHRHIIMFSMGLLAFLTALSAQAERRPVYTVAVNHAPPYRIIEEQGERVAVTGIYVDILQTLAKKMNFDVRFKVASFAQALENMKTGQADLMLGPNRTSEREIFMAYIDAPLYREAKVFIGRPDGPVAVHYSDLKEFRIGVLAKAKYSPRFDADGDLQRKAYPSYKEALEALRAGELDAVIMPALLGAYMIRQTPARYTTMPLRLSGRLSYIAISRKSPLMEHMKGLTKAMRDMMIDGTVANITHSYR